MSQIGQAHFKNLTANVLQQMNSLFTAIWLVNLKEEKKLC